MSPESQQIAIAEWYGWKLTQIADGTKFSNPEEPLMVQRWVNEKLNKVDRKLPDYLNDLNAIHEAVCNLPKSQWGYYNSELFQAACNGRNLSSAIKEPEFIFQALNASAPQCCKALLRTIGKWIEDKP